MNRRLPPPRPLAGEGAVPRGARGAAGIVRATDTSSTCCCSSTTTCSRTARTPTCAANLRCDPADGRVPTSSRSSAAATSPTTGPVSSSATRSCRCPTPRVHSTTSRAVEELLIDALGRARRARRRPVAGVPGCLGRRGRYRPAQDRGDRCALGAGPHDARLRVEHRHRHDVHAPSTSSPAASPTGPSRRSPRRVSTCRCTTSSTWSPDSRQRGGAAASSNARTSRGSSGPTI